ncbi:hypothetical protein DSO57_1013450 [Entomophthora muscae]|uniref:Uncharacterized protein n=1 Tax=Entomophthora muscae TaxID=34485 RepID=A0ACC2SIG1_9FUNG|nr:hypothetical protein DSO57_1013450 [Entomophthora muscae]
MVTGDRLGLLARVRVTGASSLPCPTIFQLLGPKSDPSCVIYEQMGLQVKFRSLCSAIPPQKLSHHGTTTNFLSVGVSCQLLVMAGTASVGIPQVSQPILYPKDLLNLASMK